MNRYQSLSTKGEVIKGGKTITSVQGLGERIIVDYKSKRFTVEPQYPSTAINWVRGLHNLGDLLRANKAK